MFTNPDEWEAKTFVAEPLFEVSGVPFKAKLNYFRGKPDSIELYVDGEPFDVDDEYIRHLDKWQVEDQIITLIVTDDDIQKAYDWMDS